MNKRLLELNFSQLSKAWEKSKFNNYSDIDKKLSIRNLSSLYDSLQSEDFDSLNLNDIIQRSHMVDFFFKNLEFLENSTLNLIPYEIVECLKHALSEWLDNSDSYIIVTSLVNNLSEFSLDPTLVFNYSMLYNVIENLYKIKFDHKLIQINIPRFLVKDYLANVVLYHELGHFIDNSWRISSIIAKSFLDEFNKGTLVQEQGNALIQYFPFLAQDSISLGAKQAFQLHMAEYFCDIFASQYIDKCSNYYLEYVTKGQNQYSDTHPSTTHRVKIVEDFLSKTSNPLVDIIVNETKKISNRDLQKRNSSILESDFLKLLPVIIKQPSELHSLFISGWNLWKNDWAKFGLNNKMQFHLENQKIYDIINNW